MGEKRVELLAPAGNPEGFYGAIHAGADAVYLGGSKFGARAYADNFTTEELVQCIRYAHLWGRKVYLTVNTLVKESEFLELYDYILPFYEAGLDGVIIQDIGVLKHLKECFPGLELHISTQMTITSAYGASLMKEMGASRIVPARELSLAEIVEMKEQTGLEMETFVHGAMCYCYSGQCLFSSILGGRSGNRGRCAQPCRLPYQVNQDGTTTKECYPLSLKDMCTVEHIPELIEAGIDSFKIEGRMKKPEYTAGVTAIYRKYIDKYYKNAGKPAKTFRVAKEDMDSLSCLYIRSERHDGYYYKHNGKEMVTLESPAYSGSDEALLSRIRQKYITASPKKSIMGYADFTTGQKATLTLICEEISITVEGDMVEPASKQPVSEENISKQLGKLGESIFSFGELYITVSENAFYPLKAINELRRRAVAALEEELLTKNGYGDVANRRSSATIGAIDCNKIDNYATTGKKYAGGHWNFSVRTTEQLTEISKFLQCNRDMSIGQIYINCDLLAEQKEEVLQLSQNLADRAAMVIALPYIIRKRDKVFLEDILTPFLQSMDQYGFTGAMVRSQDGLGYLKSIGFAGKIYGDANFYIWNRTAVRHFETTLSGFCLPLELKAGEQRPLLKQGIPVEKIVYGRIPMMITANCVAKSTTGCVGNSGDGIVGLTDRYQKTFPVVLNCRHCMNIIYNSLPLSLHGELSKWQNDTDFRLDFTVENREEVSKILSYFAKITQENTNVKELGIPGWEYTTGHEKRGVE